MYICVCNALKDKQIESAARESTRVSDVFKRCGRSPQCGKCVPEVAEIVAASRGGRQSIGSAGAGS